MVQTAEDGLGDYLANSFDSPRLRGVPIQRLMRPRGVVVVHVLAKRTKQMSLAGDMIRGKVLSVGSSQSFGTPVSYTTVKLSVLEVYGGSAEVGKPVELVISGWLESEKKEAALFEKAMKDDKEVLIPLMEPIYKGIEKEKETILVELPEGLLEMYTQ